jgi:SAM-dependent methyltransferase
MYIRKWCRLCNQPLPVQPALSLTPTPPANEFVREPMVIQEVFPLDLYICSSCGHVQLPVVVDPARLFEHYVYVSGTSPVFVDHFCLYAEQMISRFSLQPRDLVIDIGSNDGTLLKFFKSRYMRVLGIDPAVEIAAQANQDGIPTLPMFFSLDLAKRLNAQISARASRLGDIPPMLPSTLSLDMNERTKTGCASLVVANNVFAHADDLGDIADGVRRVLVPGGVFVFEVSYLVSVCENTLFDTIYHEHLAYHTLGPLILFLRRHGLQVFDAERVNTHGGSLRVYASIDLNVTMSERALQLIRAEQEHGFVSGNKCLPLDKLADKIEVLRSQLVSRLACLKLEGKRIAAFGAPAKATTLMYHFGLDRDFIDFIVDDSPLKQGLFSPGKHIPVVSSSVIEERKPDYLLILAWNFADSIIRKNQAFLDRGGKFIVPIPDYKEIGL